VSFCNCSSAPTHHQGVRNDGFGFGKCSSQRFRKLACAHVHISEPPCRCYISCVLPRI
jgi:hypothetical protein